MFVYLFRNIFERGLDFLCFQLVKGTWMCSLRFSSSLIHLYCRAVVFNIVSVVRGTRNTKS